jgi:hypothetical protein
MCVVVTVFLPQSTRLRTVSEQPGLACHPLTMVRQMPQGTTSNSDNSSSGHSSVVFQIASWQHGVAALTSAQKQGAATQTTSWLTAAVLAILQTPHNSHVPAAVGPFVLTHTGLRTPS